MAVNEKHPKFDNYTSDWEQLEDSFKGERTVKEKGSAYLPATSGMIADGYPNTNSAGGKAYNAYRTRSVFPDAVKSAVEAMLGVMHQKPPTIELPTAMEPLLEKATLKNENLEMLLRRINEKQLVLGRCGLMLDLPPTPQAGVALPYIAFYDGLKIINWDQGRRDGLELEKLNLVVLDESEHERQSDFTWKLVEKFRVLALGDVNENEPSGIYQQAVYRGDENLTFDPTALEAPMIASQTADFIPFTFINSKDIVPDPDEPPLLGLSNLAMTIYRGEADYRQSLFMQGQDTLVVMGAGEDNFRVGANASIKLPQGGDAKYIGVDSSGIPEQRAALENDYNRASQKGGELMDSVSRERESGDALKVRVAARTATLNQIALTGAYGLQNCLRQMATWMGQDPNDVIVEPNLDFVDDTLEGKTLVEMMTAKSLGLPISRQSIHKLMQNKGLTEETYEDEIGLIEEEEPLVEASTDEDGQVEETSVEE